MFSVSKKILIVKQVALALILASVGLISTPVGYAKYTSLVMGSDSVAGESSILKAKNFPADSAINFSVEKPDKTVLTIGAKTNSAGEASAVLADYHTRVAGNYLVEAFSQDLQYKSMKTSFRVFPGVLNIANSSILTTRSVIKADGSDFAEVNVILRDGYGNALEGQSVKLLSSRGADKIKPTLGNTDEMGRVSFQISSNLEGVASLMALDMASDTVLQERLPISFVKNELFLADAGGDLIKMALAAESGPLAGFEIFNLPMTIKPNENISFTVKAVDADGLTVQDYTGTVRFSAEGENSTGVTLPANYKFLAEDLGQHQFNLGLSFAQSGTYKIMVSDLNDKFKVGEKTIVVGTGSSGSTGGSASGVKPVISSPVPGTYSQSVQTISGTAKSSSTIKIYDNNQEIGSTPIGPTGKFSFQTPELAEGKHSIYVVNIDTISLEVIGTSDPVEIMVDTSAPALEDIELDPESGIKAGSVINLKIYSEKGLSQAAVIFNFDIVELNASISDPSIYVGTIQAPSEAGVYKLSVLLVDELQNEKTYEDVASVTVDPAGGTVEKSEEFFDEPAKTGEPPVNDVPEDTSGQILPVAGAPSQVSGLIAYGSDKRVTLVWDAATDDKLVKNYKIYYSDNVRDLSKNVQTRDASTTWYIPDLENGKEYFFAVTAVDDEGNESSTRSEIVSGIPFVLEIKNALSEVPTQPLDNGLRPAAYSGPFPENNTKTGPGILFLFGASAVISGLVKTRRTKK